MMNCHLCESPMIPYRKDIISKYNKVELVIKNMPVMNCVACDKDYYGTGSLIKYITLAKENYDKTGETIFVVL